MTSQALVPPVPWPNSPAADADIHDWLCWYPAVARFAPSKHNTQPWRFVVRGPSLELWTDTRRALPETDPVMRELVISCGAALHHIEVAGTACGRDLAVELLPEGGGSLLARVTDLGGSARAEGTPHELALLTAVPHRRTDRGPLDIAALAPSVPFLLQSAVAVTGASFRLVASAGDRATVAALLERADRILVRDGRLDHELATWVRRSNDPRDDGVPDDRGRGAAASYRAEFVQRDFSGGHGAAGHDRIGVDHPLVGVLCTSGDRTADWLVAGRALSALLLEATVAGANASYLNQPVELPGLRAQLRSDLCLAGEPQLVLRVGAGAAVLSTPRRTLEDIRSEG